MGLLHRLYWVVFAALFSVGHAGAPLRAAAPASRPTGEPDVRLAVVIVVDQLRADFLSRLSGRFGEDGFRRLMRQGVWFPNAYVTYGATSTAAGHATIATGRLPRQHGMISNEWFLAGEPGGPQPSVFDKDVQPVGSTTAEKGPAYSPRYLVGPAIGDELKLADRRSRVFSVSLKPRAAVLLGGQSPDGVFWWDRDSGQMQTSTWYASALPPEVAEFNTTGGASRFIGKTWDRLLPEAAYAGCYPVDPAWLATGYGLGPAFPHRIEKQAPGTGKAYDAVFASPFGNEIVLDVAKRVLQKERLGLGPACDLLCVSFSSNDLVGHLFGPSSPEYVDMVLRTDRQVADLLGAIDSQVGLARCAVVLTSDHGVKEVPQVADQLKLGGRQLDTAKVTADLNKYLAEQVGDPGEGKSYVRGFVAPWLWLDDAFAQWDMDKQMQVLYTAAEFLSNVDGIAEVFTAADLEQGPPLPQDTNRWLAWRAYCPGRSGQLYVHLEPGWHETEQGWNTGHGTAHSPDRHVPVLLAGPGVRPGRCMAPADLLDIAPTLSAMLGIEPPLNAAGRVLDEAFHRP